MCQCNTAFDLKISLGHSNLYFMVQWFFFFYVLFLLAKLNSGKLGCPVTAQDYSRK